MRIFEMGVYAASRPDNRAAEIVFEQMDPYEGEDLFNLVGGKSFPNETIRQSLQDDEDGAIPRSSGGHDQKA